ncbi:hypothetical protein Fot_20166 [Forsythia ovata]|uniref:Uncharacterized protein n=1 Tax=Forsythia ovata TaxID=205694 RepID=A0ABD1VQZ8_9LAMI
MNAVNDYKTIINRTDYSKEANFELSLKRFRGFQDTAMPYNVMSNQIFHVTYRKQGSLDEFLEVNQHSNKQSSRLAVLWMPPLTGELKPTHVQPCNRGDNFIGTGTVIQDHQGTVVASCTAQMTESFTVEPLRMGKL